MAAKRTSIDLTLFLAGETRWRREGRLQGRTDLPLSDAGRVAVSADIARLPSARIATVYHPPDEAATETAHMLARHAAAKAKAVDGLADPDLGLFEGLREQDVAERYPRRFKRWDEDPLSLVPPEGEPLADGRARIFASLAKVLRKSRAREIGLVLNPVGFGLLRCWFADRPATDLRSMLQEPPRVVRYILATASIDRLRDGTRVEVAAEGT